MKIQSGTIKLLAAGALLVLWLRGYLTAWISAAGAALQNPPAKVPFGPPGASLPHLGIAK